MDPIERAEYEAEKKRKRSESAKKGAETRKRNKRIKDSIARSSILERQDRLLEEYRKKNKKNK
jgi:hypothetical protein